MMTSTEELCPLEGSEIAGLVEDWWHSGARGHDAVVWVCGWFIPLSLLLAVAIATSASWMGMGSVLPLVREIVVVEVMCTTSVFCDPVSCGLAL